MAIFTKTEITVLSIMEEIAIDIANQTIDPDGKAKMQRYIRIIRAIRKKMHVVNDPYLFN